MSRAVLTQAIVQAIAANHPKIAITQAAANSAVDAVTSAIIHSLKTAGTFQFSGLGTFRVAARAARTGVNPQTQQKLAIPATQTVAFKPASSLKSDAPSFALPAKRGSEEAKKVVVGTPPVKAKKTVTKTSTKKAPAAKPKKATK